MGCRRLENALLWRGVRPLHIVLGKGGQRYGYARATKFGLRQSKTGVALNPKRRHCP